MIYSYKPIENPNDSQSLTEFICRQEIKEEDLAETEGLEGPISEVDRISDDEAFTFLGYVQTEEGIRGFVHVVDGITPVEQPSEIEAKVVEELPTEIANELTLKGKYAVMQRFLGGISTMPIHTTYEDEHNYAELQSQITDLMTIVSALLEATPSSLALDANTLLRIRDTLSKNVSINNKINDSLSKVGL